MARVQASQADQVSPAARMGGFIAHLRYNGFAIGPSETRDALAFLEADRMPDARSARLGLKAMLAAGRSDWERFDELFDAYWYGRGVKSLTPAARGAGGASKPNRPPIWDSSLAHAPEGMSGAFLGTDGVEEGDGGGETAVGRLAASAQDRLKATDLRKLADPREIAEAERLAGHLARVMRYRLSRRRKPSTRDRQLDLRRTIRRSLSKGGTPLDLVTRHKPDRPVNLVLLLDVSASMEVYSRFFLSFVRGLVAQWLHVDAFLFHTRLVRITEALRDKDPGRAMDRLSLLAHGFGGGTKIGESLAAFNGRYAKSVLNSRSVVIIMSDGYDTGSPEALVAELAKLKKRARRIVWLNPLLGWADYEPVARGMAAAMPYLDLFAPAHNLAALEALEADLAGL